MNARAFECRLGFDEPFNGADRHTEYQMRRPAFSVRAADTPEPVRMGCGLMTFDTVPGWGLGADGKSVLGSTHGGVAVDTAGNIYTSAHAGVFVFSPDGKVARSFLGDKYSDIHDLKARAEAGKGELR